MLIEFYKTYAKEKDFEIIYISSDRDEKAFNDYYKDMPWLTLIYSERKKKEELGKKFAITGIPTLLLIDGDSGDILCKDARDKIQHKDQRGEYFPWKSL
jgi:nucleoredoxin